jgi:hypothetical protein
VRQALPKRLQTTDSRIVAYEPSVALLKRGSPSHSHASSFT